MISKKEIFSIKNEDNFNETALKVFQFQYKNCEIYKRYVDLIKPKNYKPKQYTEIPFLPISFFKNHIVLNKNYTPNQFFQSSGTTKKALSKHYIATINWYEKSFIKTFELFFGNIKEYCFLALLPSYSENANSSLIYMVSSLMKISIHQSNGFYLYNHQDLINTLQKLKKENQKTIVFGVSFSLLDFAEFSPPSFENLIYIETGGMKGRKTEITKMELLNTLQNKLNSTKIFSEYGMTELFSQAYSLQNNIYTCPPWMKILIRDSDDPFSFNENNSGGINIIDLANVHSCSFIETEDLGKKKSKTEFEIIGRMDTADIRGCSQLIA